MDTQTLPYESNTEMEYDDETQRDMDTYDPLCEFNQEMDYDDVLTQIEIITRRRNKITQKGTLSAMDEMMLDEIDEEISYWETVLEWMNSTKTS